MRIDLVHPTVYQYNFVRIYLKIYLISEQKNAMYDQTSESSPYLYLFPLTLRAKGNYLTLLPRPTSTDN